MKSSAIKVAIFPDNFANYRVPVFKAIGRLANVELTVYSPRPRSAPGSVKSASELDNVRTGDAFHVRNTRHLYLGRYRTWTVNLLSVLFRGEYDLVISWGEVYNLSTWLALLMAKLTKTKMVLWTHGLYGTEKRIKGKAREIYYDLAEALLLYGDNSRLLLEKRGLDSKKLLVIYNSLDYDTQKKLRNNIQRSEVLNFRRSMFGETAGKVKLLLIVGRMIEVRRLDVALDALKLLNNKEDNYRFVVIGDGPMKSKYEARARHLGLSQAVIFVGEVFEERILASYFVASDLGVCPGSIGLFAVHAHAYGLPVCTHDGSLTRQKPEVEIIKNEHTGFFFRENDARDLADRLESWFAQVESSREEIGAACIQQVETRYNPKTQAEIFSNLLGYLGLNKPELRD
jgi:glycosyltransferase involved in cell wall biosynthesis